MDSSVPLEGEENEENEENEEDESNKKKEKKSSKKSSKKSAKPAKEVPIFKLGYWNKKVDPVEKSIVLDDTNDEI